MGKVFAMTVPGQVLDLGIRKGLVKCLVDPSQDSFLSRSRARGEPLLLTIQPGADCKLKMDPIRVAARFKACVVTFQDADIEPGRMADFAQLIRDDKAVVDLAIEYAPVQQELPGFEASAHVAATQETPTVGEPETISIKFTGIKRVSCLFCVRRDPDGWRCGWEATFGNYSQCEEVRRNAAFPERWFSIQAAYVAVDAWLSQLPPVGTADQRRAQEARIEQARDQIRQRILTETQPKAVPA